MSAILPTKTVTFKKIGDLEIQLDVYLPPQSQAQAVPVLLWYHGGGLLQGHRNQMAPYMRRAAAKHNLAVISSDYRFCPQATVADVLTDVLDGIAFVRNGLVSHLPANAIDPNRLAVSGSSAGGYLALLAGLYAEPKPKALVPIYPIADPFGSFFTNPQPAPFNLPLLSPEQLAASLDPSAPQQANCGPMGQDTRMNMYTYMLHHANLAQLYGLDRQARQDEAEKFRIARNIFAKGLPPSYVLHGDADQAVGVEQADEVVGVMTGCGLEVVYQRPRGKNHFCDTAEDFDSEPMFRFILNHV